MELNPANPFKGLQPYSQQDQEKLFGREKDLVLIKDRIYSAKTTLLFAGSGVGKTSFLNAKVIPEFRQQYSTFYHNDWAGKDKPLDAVKKGLIKQLGLDENASQRHLNDILAGFRKAESDQDLNAAMSLDSGAPRRCLLILDQFEEVFQYHSYEDYFEQFLDELCTTINNPDLQLRVVFSMREEFLGELSVFDNRVPDLFYNYYRLKYPDKVEAKDIITLTCELVDVKVNEEKMSQLVRDLSKVEKTAASYTEYAHDEDKRKTRMIERGFIVPPYLQIACQRLWNKQFTPRKDGGKDGGAASKFFLEGYGENEAQAVLQDFCTEKLNRLNFIERYTAARAFNFLVTKQGAKMAYESKRLSQHMRVGEKRLKSTLEKLSKPDTRILRISRGPDGSNWFELYHDMYGTIVDKWKQGFQRKLMRWTFGAFAGLTLITGLVLVLLLAVPYWITKPREFQRTIRTADASNFRIAEDAYNKLRGTYGYSATADALWAQFWERRAAHAKRTEKREEALISSLQALAVEPDPQTAQRRRIDAGLLLGDDRDRLLVTYWHAGILPTAIFSPDGKYVLTQTYVNREAAVRVWETGIGKPVSFSPDGEPFLGQNVPGKSFVEQTAPVNLEPPRRKEPNSKEIISDASGEGFAYRSKVKAVVVTPNPGVLIAGTRLNPTTDREEVLVWRADSGKIYPNLERQWCKPGSNLTVTFSPDGRYLAAGNNRGEIYVWELDADSKQPLFRVSQPGGVNSLAISPDGTTLLSGGRSGRVYLWDVDTGKLRKSSTGAARPINRVTFSPDGTAFLTQHEDGSLQVWETNTGNPSGQRIETGYIAITANLSRDNKTVVSLFTTYKSSDRARYLSELEFIESLSSQLYRGLDAEDELMYNSFLESRTTDGIMQVWDSQTNKLLNQNIVNVKNHSNNLLSSDGEAMLTAIKDGVQLLRVPVQSITLENKLGAHIGFLHFSPDGKTLSHTFVDGSLQLLDAQTGTAFGPPKQYGKPDEKISDIYRNIIAIDEGNTVRVMEFGSDRLVASLLHSGKVTGIKFSPDGKTLATSDATNVLHFWDTSSYSKKSQSAKQKERIDINNFSPTGKYLVTRPPDTYVYGLSIWDVTTGNQLDLPKGDRDAPLFSHSLTFSKEDGMLAFSDRTKTLIWELSSGKLVNTLPVDARDFALSNDGKRILIQEANNAIRMWDVEKATPLEPTISNLFYYSDLSFTPDGRSAVIITPNWVHLYDVQAASLSYKSSRWIGDRWTSKLFLDESGQNIRFAFYSFEGNHRFKDVRFNAPDPAVTISGEPKALLNEWLNKLASEFDTQGNFTPKWQKKD